MYGIRKWAIEELVQWLYRGSIEVPRDRRFLDYVDLWNFAENLQIEALQNLVMDKAREYCQGHRIGLEIFTNRHLDISELSHKMEIFIVNQVAWEIFYYGAQNVAFAEDFFKFCKTDPETASKVVLASPHLQLDNHQSSPAHYSNLRFHVHDTTPRCEDEVEESSDDIDETTSTMVDEENQAAAPLSEAQSKLRTDPAKAAREDAEDEANSESQEDKELKISKTKPLRMRRMGRSARKAIARKAKALQ